MIYRILISSNYCVCSILNNGVDTYNAFNILETSVLTKLNEWYRLQCTSWVRILFENHVFSISLHASFPFFRAVSQSVSIVSSHVSIVCWLCCLLYPIILHWMELDNRLSGRLQNNNDHDMREKRIMFVPQKSFLTKTFFLNFFVEMKYWKLTNLVYCYIFHLCKETIASRIDKASNLWNLVQIPQLVNELQPFKVKGHGSVTFVPHMKLRY